MCSRARRARLQRRNYRAGYPRESTEGTGCASSSGPNGGSSLLNADEGTAHALRPGCMSRRLRAECVCPALPDRVAHTPGQSRVRLHLSARADRTRTRVSATHRTSPAEDHTELRHVALRPVARVPTRGNAGRGAVTLGVMAWALESCCTQPWARSSGRCEEGRLWRELPLGRRRAGGGWVVVRNSTSVHDTEFNTPADPAMHTSTCTAPHELHGMRSTFDPRPILSAHDVTLNVVVRLDEPRCYADARSSLMNHSFKRPKKTFMHVRVLCAAMTMTGLFVAPAIGSHSSFGSELGQGAGTQDQGWDQACGRRRRGQEWSDGPDLLHTECRERRNVHRGGEELRQSSTATTFPSTASRRGGWAPSAARP